MKKIIGIIFISLMFTNIGSAEIRTIEKKKIRESYNLTIETICIDGYKFVFSEDADSISMVQFYEGPDLPARC